MTKPYVAWIGVDGLRKLEQIIRAAAPDQQEAVWTALTPLLNDPTEADWLPRVETVLRANAASVAAPLTNQLRNLIRHSLTWQELIDAVTRDWPECPNPLEHRDVLRRLEQLAAQVTGLSRSIQRHVIEDAPGKIFEAFATFRRCERFNCWAQRVLYNHGVSLYRSGRRSFPDSEYLNTVASPVASGAEFELAAILHDFRHLCDTAHFPPRTAKGTELVAVFALESRLRLLPDLVRWGPDFLDSHLPLRDWERILRVKPNWPMLGELWDVLANAPEAGLRNIDAVRSACRQLAPTVPINALHKVWNNWLHRAKGVVERQLESPAQAHLFFYLFPRHRPVEADVVMDEPEGRRQAS